MKNIADILKIISGFLVVFIVFSTFLNLSPGSVVNAILFSEATDEQSKLLNLVASVVPQYDGISHGQSVTDKESNNDFKDKNNEDESLSASVEEAVFGNIVKKTMSPYSANLKSGDIYINNQSGAVVNIKSELSKGLEFDITKDENPQILIYHTHTTESYMMSEEEYYTSSDEPRTTDESKNVVAIGKKIAEQLEAEGYSVIHDTTIHDYPGFSGSYSRSAETVKAILQKYSSIKVAIDVHRDSINQGDNDKIAPVVNINGREAAQVMLVMGSQTGSISDYPDWRHNLRFAMKMQNIFESKYPQFARALLLRSTKYNQNLTKGSVLIEVGSEANTISQAMYSAELIGKTLVEIFDS